MVTTITTPADGSTATQPGMSLTEYLARSGERFELFDGEEIPMSPHLMEHDEINFWLQKSLLSSALQNNLSHRIAAEYTFVDPESVTTKWIKGSLVPDIVIIEGTRISEYKARHPNWRKTPLALVPDLAIEILSPNDHMSDVLGKIGYMLKLGVKTVWFINPRNQTVTIYVDEPTPTTLTGEEVLTTDLLPGWSIAVRDLFADEFGSQD